MATAISCQRSPLSDYEASYSPHIQPITLSELDGRGETPVDESAKFSLPISGMSKQASCDVNLNPPGCTVDAISVPPDNRAPLPPSDSPKCLPVPEQTSRKILSGTPSHLGSPVVLNLDRSDRVVGNLTFPLIHSSPIQETFDFSQEQPLVLNRRTRWLSAGRSLTQQSERDLNKGLIASNLTEVEALRRIHRYHLQHPNNSISNLKSTSLNKSEPNLVTPSYDSSFSTVPTFDVISMDQATVSPDTKPHEAQFSLSEARSNLLEVGEVHRTPNQTIKSLFNQTSKRISQFTSRRHGFSTSLESLPSTLPSTGSSPSDNNSLSPRSPATIDDLQRGSNQSKASTVSYPPFSSELLPCQMSHLPLVSRTTPPAELPKPTNKPKRTNTRIHSPNFYQSLKSRWKANSLPTDNVSGSTSKSPLPSNDCPQTDFNLEKNLPEQQKNSSSLADPLEDCCAAERSLQLGVAESISSKPMTGPIQSAPENLQTSTLSPDITRGRCHNDLIPHVKPSPKQEILSQENQFNEAQHLISSEKLVSMLPKESSVTHDHSIGGSKSNSASIRRPQRGAGILSHFLLPNQMDGSISDNVKSEKMDIIEGLLHKNHLNFASRRSSISKVLKRPDSIDASTPLLFQGIWEKELEENERRWKRLARMSGSQPSSIYSEPPSEKEDNTHKHDGSTLVNKDLLMRQSSTRTSSHSKKSSRNFCQPEVVQPCEIAVQNDVLEKVWDSFKSEAEISLSDINCDGSLVGRFASSFDPLGCSAEADPLALPLAEPLSSYLDGVETPGNVDDRAEKLMGLGLFHPCGQPADSSFPVSSDFSPITSPKLKKLSLLSNNPICSSLLGSSRSKRRPTTSKPPLKATRTTNLEANSSSIDLSLLNAFPAPPYKPQSKQSSLSFSLKPLKLPDSPRNNPTLLAMPPASQMAESTSERPYRDQTVINQTHPISTLKPSTSKLISFTPTSFSNRPRAQTSGRSPIPPPLKLRTMSPQPNSSHRRRPLTATFNNSGNSSSGAVPPVPLLRAPNTAPLESRPIFESNRRERNTEPAHSCDLTPPTLTSVTMSSKLSTCGLTPKRPSLLMRPSSRSPRMLGGARTKETNLPAYFNSAHTAVVASLEPCSPCRTTQPVGQSTSILPTHYPVDQAGCFSSPHTSVGSSTGTASSGSTVPSPATPTSLRMTYNSRIPPVPMHHHPLCSPSSHSPIQSNHPDNPRYVIIDQTPKYSTSDRVAPNTIKASRIYIPELPKSKPSPEPVEQVSYGMAL